MRHSSSGSLDNELPRSGAILDQPPFCQLQLSRANGMFPSLSIAFAVDHPMGFARHPPFHGRGCSTDGIARPVLLPLQCAGIMDAPREQSATGSEKVGIFDPAQREPSTNSSMLPTPFIPRTA